MSRDGGNLKSRRQRLSVLALICTVAWIAPDARSAAAGGLQSPGAPGSRPAGRLILEPIVISPPLEFIPTDEGPIVPPRWRFPQRTVEELVRALTAVGFTADEAVRLGQRAEKAPAGQAGFVIMPDVEMVRSLDPGVRAALYRQLAKNPLNFRQQAAYRFHGASADEWLGTGLSPRTRALVDPLIYRDGAFLFFADLELVRAEIGHGPELQRLVKRLLSQATLVVSLGIDETSSVSELVEYWGRGGRKTDIRPLIESMAADPATRRVDLTYLLPEFARGLLYRYPKVSRADLRKPQLANCFWTALNFFNARPDNRFLDPAVALDTLYEDYYIVQDALQLGDIVAFSDRDLNIFHVAVYLADDLVFTKNGYFSLAPWTILPMDRLKGHFAEHADNWRVTYYRRGDF